MSRSFRFVLALLFVAAFSFPLYAQSGCTDSPENSTVVLALVGSAGALWTCVRGRIKK